MANGLPAGTSLAAEMHEPHSSSIKYTNPYECSLGCFGETQLDCLRAASPDEILAVAKRSYPCVKGKMFPAQAMQMFAEGQYHKVRASRYCHVTRVMDGSMLTSIHATNERQVPQLLGSNADEGTVWAFLITGSTTEATAAQYLSSFGVLSHWKLMTYGQQLYYPYAKQHGLWDAIAQAQGGTLSRSR